MRLKLVAPSLALEAPFMAMVDEFLAAGEREYVYEEVLFNRGFEAYVAWLAKGERDALEGLSPWSAYWAVAEETGMLVGISSLRHKLSPFMAQFGGHIGYRVRPSERRKKFGSAILRLTLKKASSIGITKALVVCTPENTASQGVLRICGAEFENEVSVNGVSLLRYWVSTHAASDTAA